MVASDFSILLGELHGFKSSINNLKNNISE